MDAVVAGRYRLLERIAVSEMSEVWEADDLELERRVALKLLGRGADPDRFEREAQAAAGLSHPNICRLFDFGETDGRPYIVFELLPGGSLESRLPAGRPLPDAEAARVAGELAAALGYAGTTTAGTTAPAEPAPPPPPSPTTTPTTTETIPTDTTATITDTTPTDTTTTVGETTP